MFIFFKACLERKQVKFGLILIKNTMLILKSLRQHFGLKSDETFNFRILFTLVLNWLLCFWRVMKHLAICSFYGLKLQRNVHYITMSQLCISHGLTFFSEALCWYTSCAQVWFFDWITIFPHCTTVHACTLHFLNQYSNWH